MYFTQFAFEGANVCAEGFPEVLVASLSNEVEVHFADGGQEAVGVVRVNDLIPVGDAQAVVGNGFIGQNCCPDAVLLVGGFILTGFGDNGDGICQVPDRADGYRTVVDVATEHRVR